jgi:hypothetical protein
MSSVALGDNFQNQKQAKPVRVSGRKTDPSQAVSSLRSSGSPASADKLLPGRALRVDQGRLKRSKKSFQTRLTRQKTTLISASPTRTRK